MDPNTIGGKAIGLRPGSSGGVGSPALEKTKGQGICPNPLGLVNRLPESKVESEGKGVEFRKIVFRVEP